MAVWKGSLKIAVGFALIYAMSLAQVHAQQVAIDNGVTYLRSTQSPDGSWGGTATSLNTILQSTSTTARTLQLLGISDTTLTNALGFLSAQTPNTVDDLAQQFEVLAASGADVTSLVASIKSAQQADGGWGIDLEKSFPSEVVDTLSAVRALKTAGVADTTTVSKALGYLLGTQNSDGGFGFYSGDGSNVYMTAMVLNTLSQFKSIYNLQTPISNAISYLLTKQNTDGGFGFSPSTVYETALALISLIDSGQGQAQPIQNVINYLTTAQQADGSWNQDPYSTALAKRLPKKYLTKGGGGVFIMLPVSIIHRRACGLQV